MNVSFNFKKNMVIFKPTTKKELQNALMDWTYDDEGSEKKYGLINTWDTSLLDDSSLFLGSNIT